MALNPTALANNPGIKAFPVQNIVNPAALQQMAQQGPASRPMPGSQPQQLAAAQQAIPITDPAIQKIATEVAAIQSGFRPGAKIKDVLINSNHPGLKQLAENNILLTELKKAKTPDEVLAIFEKDGIATKILSPELAQAAQQQAAQIDPRMTRLVATHPIVNRVINASPSDTGSYAKYNLATLFNEPTLKINFDGRGSSVKVEHPCSITGPAGFAQSLVGVERVAGHEIPHLVLKFADPSGQSINEIFVPADKAHEISIQDTSMPPFTVADLAMSGVPSDVKMLRDVIDNKIRIMHLPNRVLSPEDLAQRYRMPIDEVLKSFRQHLEVLPEQVVIGKASKGETSISDDPVINLEETRGKRLSARITSFDKARAEKMLLNVESMNGPASKAIAAKLREVIAGKEKAAFALVGAQDLAVTARTFELKEDIYIKLKNKDTGVVFETIDMKQGRVVDKRYAEILASVQKQKGKLERYDVQITNAKGKEVDVEKLLTPSYTYMFLDTQNGDAAVSVIDMPADTKLYVASDLAGTFTEAGPHMMDPSVAPVWAASMHTQDHNLQPITSGLGAVFENMIQGFERNPADPIEVPLMEGPGGNTHTAKPSSSRNPLKRLFSRAA